MPENAAAAGESVLPFLRTREKLNTFGYPYAEVGGTAIDFYQPQNFVHRYSFKEKLRNQERSEPSL